MSAPEPGARTPEDQIADEILSVHESSYGVGASDVVVHLLDDAVVVLIDGLELTAGERTLIEGGEGRHVLRMRTEFQGVIEPTFTAIVERATGRRVRTFFSNTSLEDLLSVEFFRLHPVGA